MDSFPLFDLPNELQYKIWSCLDDEADINEKLFLGFYFIDSKAESESREERWIKENIGLELSCDSKIKEEYALLFYKFQSEIGKELQANFNLEIPSRVISQFANYCCDEKKNWHMTNFATSRLYEDKYYEVTENCDDCLKMESDFVLCAKHLKTFISDALKVFERWVAWDPQKELFEVLESDLKTRFIVEIHLDCINRTPVDNLTEFDKAFLRQGEILKRDLFPQIRSRFA